MKRFRSAILWKRISAVFDGFNPGILVGSVVSGAYSSLSALLVFPSPTLQQVGGSTSRSKGYYYVNGTNVVLLGAAPLFAQMVMACICVIAQARKALDPLKKRHGG